MTNLWIADSSDSLSCLPFPSKFELLDSCFGIYFIPILLLIYIISLGLYQLRNLKLNEFNPFEQRRVTPLIKTLYTFGGIVLLSYLADCLIIIFRALESKTWSSSSLVFYAVTSWTAWLINFILIFIERKRTGGWSLINYLFSWFSLTGEFLVFRYWILLINHNNQGKFIANYDLAFFSISTIRFVALIILCIVPTIQILHLFLTHVNSESEYSRGLLQDSTSYGTFPTAPSENNVSSEQQIQTPQESAFSNFFSKMKRLIPFIWPKNKPWLQFLVYVCFGLLILGRIINVLVPYQLKIIVDYLGGEGGDQGRFPWMTIIFYVFLRFLQGGVGLIQASQNYLWIPIGQTGEVLRVMDRGTNSIISLLSQIFFQILPVIVDIFVAVVIFVILFEWQIGAIVFITMSSYIFVTIWITEWRTKFRRVMIELDNDARTKAVDSLLNFETVKYYNAEQFEVQRYDEAIRKFQVYDYKVSASLNVLNLSQNMVITCGLLAGCLLFAYQITQNIYSVGDFVLFIFYMNQLYSPLNFFGTYYRMIQQNFVDMEKMLDLFKEEQSVQDLPGAPQIRVTEGKVEFDNVNFSYDPRNQALKNVSFTIPKGKTVALVGPSGGGNVTQESLRRNIGVVPQDTVLFNDTVFYNIHYGNVNAPEEEVFKAAKAAQIHDRTLTFPDERGLRLSGGEKQRVAIARTILKNPPIILLDEATSALDTTTERQIQKALYQVTANRTTLVIAHRLNGQVVEQGTHEELIRLAQENKSPGVYYEMWQKQLRDHEEAGVEAEGSSNDSTGKNKNNESLLDKDIIHKHHKH
ncbi:9370_t:CDS:10 [Diversispora eburnea]|uniref:9370_t:CDS:1 n=1 Tax=Diversispora eburnea TaxID=1213867 RepID=A0A9N8V3V3_9GLOM|nr:9370_t:CDS:10 [Diversispora eburnea]